MSEHAHAVDAGHHTNYVKIYLVLVALLAVSILLSLIHI